MLVSHLGKGDYKSILGDFKGIGVLGGKRREWEAEAGIDPWLKVQVFGGDILGGFEVQVAPRSQDNFITQGR